jgi:hypothetical protein
VVNWVISNAIPAFLKNLKAACDIYEPETNYTDEHVTVLKETIEKSLSNAFTL